MKKIVFSVLVSIFTLNSCTRNLEQINTDKDNFTEQTATVKLLMPNIQIQLADAQVQNNFELGNKVSQHITYIQYNQIDVYSWTADGRYWSLYNQLQNIADVEKIGKINNQPQHEGVALVLKSLIFSQISDAYGYIPFTEAGKAEAGNLTPKYDSQETVYKGLNEMLKSANEKLAEGGTVDGDRLFGGDSSKWRKFANSLRIRILTKMMNKVDVKSEIADIFNNPGQYPVFASNTDQAVYHYPGTGNLVSPYSSGRGRAYEIEQLTALSTTMKNTLEQYNDPRLSAWYEAPKNNPSGNYIGVEPGVYTTDFKNISMLSLSFFQDPNKIKAIFMTYSELEFLLAEAAEKLWISSDPKVHYDKAVKASFDFWGVAMPADYLTSLAKYTNPNPGLIATQKWIAFFWNGFEAWNDFKRTGLPSLKPSNGNINNNVIPSRLIYPSIEQSVNGASYNAAISAMGKDNINTKMWWQN